MDSQGFARLLLESGRIDSALVPAVVQFREVLLLENQRQNLTRITAPGDFLEGHVLDCVELLASGLLEFPALDLGSGGGVPGLLSAVLGSGPWVLSDSEGSKADFLWRATQELSLEGRVSVFSGRAEQLLRSDSVSSVVARAVGKIEKIFGWVEHCSTWNNLILLKGPGWDQEWQEFLASRHRSKLALVGAHRYTVGPEQKPRIIVKLQRVKFQGTK